MVTSIASPRFAQQETVRDIAKYDPQTGATTVVNQIVYDAFGNVTSESNPTVDSLFLLTARPFDANTALQNNLNRWYDPAVGRWLSEDPIGFAAGDENLSRYMGNGVLRVVEPTGVGPFSGAFLCRLSATSAGFVYSGWIVAWVACLAAGEGAGVIDAAECRACVGGARQRCSPKTRRCNRARNPASGTMCGSRKQCAALFGREWKKYATFWG